MRVLVLSQWYPPEPQSVVSDLAETLAAQGHDVAVLTGFPNWPSGRIYAGYRIQPFRRENWNGVPVVRVPLFPYHGRSPIGRIANLVSFCLSALLLGPWLVRRPDVVHVIQPPTSCLPGWFLSRVWRVPFTYEVQDLWPDTLRATGMMEQPGALGLVAGYCRWVYRKAAKIRVISHGFRSELLARGVPADKLHVIPNWVDVDRYQPARSHKCGTNDASTPPRFRIFYAGNLGLAQGLDNVLDAAALLPATSPVRFVLVGDGVDADALREKVAALRLDNVEFLGRFPQEEMRRVLADADAFLLHLKNDPLFSVTIPSKLLTYLAMGKPIIACASGEPSDIVEQSGAGLSCPPGDPAALAAVAGRMAALPDRHRAEMARAGRELACTNFERTAVVAEIGKMLAAAVERAS